LHEEMAGFTDHYRCCRQPLLKAAAKTIEATLFAVVSIIFSWIGQRDCWQ
jgi:hypothetical protein